MSKVTCPDKRLLSSPPMRQPAVEGALLPPVLLLQLQLLLKGLPQLMELVGALRAGVPTAGAGSDTVTFLPQLAQPRDTEGSV